MFSRSTLLSQNAILLYLVLLKLGAHLLTNSQYGFHRDELAYVDDGKRLAWGFVDHPPVAPALATTARTLFGDDSLAGLRLFSALAGAGVVWLTVLMARELGGGRLAQALAGAAVIIAPLYLITGTLFQAVAFDQLWWVLSFYLVIRLIKTENARLWLALGAVSGVGLMTKYTMAFCLAALGVGMLLTPQRRYLRSPWLWLGALLALAIVLPNLIWLSQNEWISLTYTRAINARDASLGRTSGFLPEQFLIMNPIAVPIWLAGLYFYFSPRGRAFRWLGWAYVAALLLFLILGGRAYYLGPAYPMLLAAGAVVIEQVTAARAWRWLRAAAAGALIGLPLAPVGSPAWEIATEINEDFPEMIGWEELVATVGAIYQALPPEEQARTVILAGNYGEAGAINLYGETYGLPEAVSPVNSYYYWSQGRLAGEVYIVLGFDEDELRTACAGVQAAGTVSNRYGIENEETRFHRVIYLCRSPRVPLEEIWPELQAFA